MSEGGFDQLEVIVLDEALSGYRAPGDKMEHGESSRRGCVGKFQLYPEDVARLTMMLLFGELIRCASFSKKMIK